MLPLIHTIKSAVMAAYMRLLDNSTAFGQAIECWQDKHPILPEAPLLNGRVSKRALTV